MSLAKSTPAGDLPPSQATDAVLVKSSKMPADAQKVEELDFNKFKGRPITADDLYQGMRFMGFQASGVAEAIRIINDMVGCSKYYVYSDALIDKETDA